MGRLAGFSSREVRRVAEWQGWVLHRTSGDHFVYRKAGVQRNVSMPGHREAKEALLHQLGKDLELTIDEFLELARK